MAELTIAERMEKIRKDMAELAEDLKTELGGDLAKIVETIEKIESTGVMDILKDKTYAKYLAEITKRIGGDKAPAPTPYKKKPKLSEQAVIKFLGKKSKTKTELSTHFSGGNTKVIKFLNSMVKDKKLESTTAKNKRNIDVTSYKVK